MDMQSKLISFRKKPTRVGDKQWADGRGDNYGGGFVNLLTARDDALADEGSYFVLSSPVPGTGLPTIAAPITLTDLSPFILLRNDAAATEAERVTLKYLKLTVTAPGTAGTAIRYAVKTDGINPARYTSGGNATNTPANPLNLVNVNADDSTSPNVFAAAGALVAAAAPAARLITSGIFRPVIPVIGDTYLLNFGGPSGEIGSLAPAGVAIAGVTFPAPPVVIGPQQWFAFHLWLPAQSAASSYEFELGYSKR